MSINNCPYCVPLFLTIYNFCLNPLTSIMTCIIIFLRGEKKSLYVSQIEINVSDVRDSKNTKTKPSIMRKTHHKAIEDSKTLGRWMEEAIEEKATREKRAEAQLS